MRLDKDDYFMELAWMTARRSTCLSRHVGAVLVDHHDHVVATGYNGAPRGLKNCDDLGMCVRERLKSTEGLVDHCRAVHAEANALLQCPNVEAISKIYVTTSPCKMCTRLLLNTNCLTVVASEIYDQKAVDFWLESNRNFVLLKRKG